MSNLASMLSRLGDTVVHSFLTRILSNEEIEEAVKWTKALIELGLIDPFILLSSDAPI